MTKTDKIFQNISSHCPLKRLNSSLVPKGNMFSAYFLAWKTKFQEKNPFLAGVCIIYRKIEGGKVYFVFKQL